MVGLFNSFVDLLYEVLKFYQGLTEPVLGNQSYWFAIVLLTLSVRVLLIPLTVKQVRSSRAMSALQPELKKLQEKHRDDRQRLNQEMMELYKQRGVNPLAGCLPLLVQMPFFFALYQVIYRKNIAGEPNILLNHGFFGIRLDTVWWQLPWDDRFISVTGIVILVLILAMGATTFISQRQLMSRQTMQMNPQQAMLMRVLPLMFVVFAVGFPLAVIIYWLTSNLWSMGQQYMILRNQPLPEAANGAATQATAKGGKRTVGEVTRPAAKSGGLLGMLRAQVEGAGTTRNGSGGSSNKSSNRSSNRSDSTSDRQKGGAKSSGSGRQGGSGSSTTARKGSRGGQRTGSSSRSGGGKGSGRGQQRRRKR